MAYNFISCSLDGPSLSRHDLRGWLPPQHLCWQVLKVVGELDLSGFLRGYRADGQGAAAYPPQVLLGLVLYCYYKGIRTSRRIEAACLDDVGCRIITGHQPRSSRPCQGTEGSSDGGRLPSPRHAESTRD